MASRKARAGGGEAARGARAGGVDLSTHPLVSKLQPDPENAEPAREVATLVGYIGPSKRDGHVRLYQDLSFQNYYEIPADAVTATNPINPDDENSPTAVQVEPDAKVEVVTVSAQSVEARYLSGAIASGFYGAAAGVAGEAAAGFCTNITTHMPSCVQPVCDPNCVATVVTSHHAAAPAAQFGVAAGVGQAVNPQLLCWITRPTYCITVVTARPTHCRPFCRPWGFPTRLVACGATDFPSCDVQVTVDVTIPGPFAAEAGAQQFAAAATPGAAAQPLLCALTRVPTVCGPICPAYFTARPTHCGPVCRPWGFPTRPPCIVTRYPTFCIPNPCGIVATHFPSCDVQVTVTVTIPGPGPVIGGGFAAAAAQPQAACITQHTAVPSWCDPPCQPIANTAATLCTQHLTTGPDPATVFCPTVYTATPTGCG